MATGPRSPLSPGLPMNWKSGVTQIDFSSALAKPIIGFPRQLGLIVQLAVAQLEAESAGRQIGRVRDRTGR